VTALEVSIPVTALADRMRARLGGVDAPPASVVVWQRDDGQAVSLATDSLKVRAVDGWLLAELSASTDQTGSGKLQLVFRLGRRGEGDGPIAAATINVTGPTTAALADRWGPDLQRVLWDGVLDAIEASVQHAEESRPGAGLVVNGFHCRQGAVAVDVVVEG